MELVAITLAQGHFKSLEGLARAWTDSAALLATAEMGVPVDL